MAEPIVRDPSVREISFNCPHCGALAKQFWSSTFAKSLRDDNHPQWMTREEAEQLLASVDDVAQRRRMQTHFDRLISMRPFEATSGTSSEYVSRLHNVHVSRCYNCGEIAVWLGEGMVWPNRGSVQRPNPDMPNDALLDYDEASQIVDHSPRGAAALLRLSISKICVALGCPGRNLNDDIGELVERGLDVRVQQALDVVRVVGNNAVHPGELNIKDDREIADKLFGLVNLIVDIMISQPKQVGEMFADLPEGALKAIARRDNSD